MHSCDARAEGCPIVARKELLTVPELVDRPQGLLTIQEVAKLLRVPISWVYDRLRRNAPSRLPGFKLGKYWRFKQAEVLAWLDARHV